MIKKIDSTKINENQKIKNVQQKYQKMPQKNRRKSLIKLENVSNFLKIIELKFFNL